MISLIICSKYPETAASLAKNIQDTIGVDYEIVHIDNSRRQYGICEAYNIGVGRAKGDYLCFMHEDLIFHSYGWGASVEYYLRSGATDMLGIAGCFYVPARYDWRFGKLGYVHLIQGLHTFGEHPVYYNRGIRWNVTAPLKRVAIVDGCWFCIKKEHFLNGKMRFDSETFKDFHLYDSDISMQANMAGLTISVSSDIIIEHTSEGYYTTAFKDGNTDFINKWKEHLPYAVKELGKNDEVITEEEAERMLVERLEQDRHIAEINAYFDALRRRETPAPLSDKCKRLIEKSLFNYAKIMIKYSRSSRDAKRAMAIYYASKYGSRSRKLRRKLVYYRYVAFWSRRKKLKKVATSDIFRTKPARS
jgi:glycosyltransferase involved in cell wall biosynthesis